MQQVAPWERYRTPQAPAAPPVIQGPPRQPAPQTPAQAEADRGRAAAAPYEAPAAAANVQRTRQQTQQSDTRGINYSDERSMRSDFEGLPDVRNYRAVLPQVEAARRAAAGGAGDLNLVYAFAKVMDPGSVVREGEVQMSQDTGGLGDRIRGMLQGLRNGQRLTANVRQGLMREIENRASQYAASYRQLRKQYYGAAQDYGFDPERVLGPDASEAYQPGPNAPVTATPPGAPGSPAVTSSDGPAWAATAGAQAVNSVSQPQPQLPAVNAPGAPTATDSRENAMRSAPVAPQADNTGTASNPMFSTEADNTYNNAWASAVNSGATLDQLNQWLRDNYPRFYPGANPPEVSDDQWAIIENSRRTGARLDWQPNQHGIRDITQGVDLPVVGHMSAEDIQGLMNQQYHDQADRARGAEARRQWADEHPILSRVDTVARQGANALLLGLPDHFEAWRTGTSPAYQHGITGADWQDRPIESVLSTALAGSRLPYGATLPRQIGAGAGYGALGGFTQSDGSLGDRITNAAQGAFVDAGTNALLGGATRAVRAPNADEILAAGERQNVPVPRYMLGREPAQVATGAVGATPGRVPLARAAGRVIDALASARDRAAQSIGLVGDNYSAGRAAQRGARQFLDQSEQRGAQLFDRIPIAPRTRADLANTRAVLNEVTQGLESNPRLSALLEDPQLIRFRDALNEGGLSWADMKQFRSTIGRMIGRAQVASEGTHAQDLRALYAGLTRDMEATAAAQGPRALSMFRRANQYWRGREARREGVIQDILGRNMDAAPEDTYRLINGWAQRDTGDTGALRQAMRSLPADDANAVRATIFARMGRATAGQQDETGNAFSPYVFATQWSKLEPRARALLVPNAAHRRNLDDIALLATSMRRSERFTNTSNTGLGANLGLFTLGGMANLPAAAGAGLTTYAMGRMLSSPAGSRTLLRALRNPEAFSGLLADDSSAGE